LLVFYRAHYKRATLVEYRAFRDDFYGACAGIASRSGLAIGRVVGTGDLLPPASEDIQSPAAAAERLLAMQLLTESSVSQIMRELEASALPSSNPPHLLERLDNLHRTALNKPVARLQMNSEAVSSGDTGESQGGIEPALG